MKKTPIKAKSLMWDWSDTAPITAIIEYSKSIKNAKAWRVDWSDMNHLIIAASEQDALELWKYENMDFLKDSIHYEGGHESDYYPRIEKWED